MASVRAKSQHVAIKEVILNSFYSPADPPRQAVLFDSVCGKYRYEISWLGRLSLRDSCRAKKIGPIREF